MLAGVTFSAMFVLFVGRITKKLWCIFTIFGEYVDYGIIEELLKVTG